MRGRANAVKKTRMQSSARSVYPGIEFDDSPRPSADTSDSPHSSLFLGHVEKRVCVCVFSRKRHAFEDAFEDVARGNHHLDSEPRTKSIFTITNTTSCSQKSDGERNR